MMASSFRVGGLRRGWVRLASSVLLTMGLVAGSAGGANAQEDALSGLRAAAKADPKDPNAALALGRALRRAGHYDEARTALGSGILTPAARRTGLIKSLLHELALTHIERRNLPGAFDACKKLTELPDARALGFACTAEAHLMRNRATEALPEADRALSKDPSLYEGKVVKGRILAFQQKLGEAERLLRDAATQNAARAEAHHHLGRLMINSGRAPAAVAPLKRAHAIDPGNPHIAADLGDALGMTTAAETAFGSSVKSRPSFARGHAGLARVAAHRGNLKVAEDAANKAIKLAPTSFAAHLALGRVRMAQKRWADALKMGEKARKLVPNKAAAEMLVADAHAGAGDIDMAVEHYQAAFGMDRTSPMALIAASKACRDASRLTTARGFADRATGDFPKSGPAWVELGEVRARQGARSPARDAFNKALALGGEIDRNAVQARLSSLK